MGHGVSLVAREEVEKLLLLAGALRAGLIDALAGADGAPAADAAPTADELARRASADPRATGVVLEALASLEVVERITGSDGEPRFRLTELGRRHLVDPGPELERSGLIHQADKARGWLELATVIRTGRPAPREHKDRDVRHFSLAMAEREPDTVEELVTRCLAYSGPIRTMIDVGGAAGHIALRFHRSGVRATVLDRPDTVPIAREYLGPAASEIGLVAMDLTRELPAGPYDLAYLGHVCHIYPPEVNAALMRRVRGVLAPNGTVAVHDMVWGRSPRAPLFAVNMLQATERGGVWTEDQFRTWLREAGFTQVQVVDLSTASDQLILGRVDEKRRSER